MDRVGMWCVSRVSTPVVGGRGHDDAGQPWLELVGGWLAWLRSRFT